jgi:acyl carrier protein
MSARELSSFPTVPEIVQTMLTIMRHHTSQAGEGWNRATTIEQAGINSLELVELIFDLEDQYNIDVRFNPRASNDTLATVEDVARLVQTSIRRERAVPHSVSLLRLGS